MPLDPIHPSDDAPQQQTHKKPNRLPADPSRIIKGLALARFSAIVQFAVPIVLLTPAYASGAAPPAWIPVASLLVYTVASWLHAIGCWRATTRLPWEPGIRRSDNARVKVRLCLLLSTALSIAGCVLGITGAATAPQQPGTTATFVFLWPVAIVFAQVAATIAFYVFLINHLIAMAQDTMDHAVHTRAKSLRVRVWSALGVAAFIALAAGPIIAATFPSLVWIVVSGACVACIVALVSYAGLLRLVEKSVRTTDAQLSTATDPAAAPGTLDA